MMRRRELARLVEEQASRFRDVDAARAVAVARAAELEAAAASRARLSRRPVIVNRKDGSWIRGVIWNWSAGVIELKGAVLTVQPGSDPVPVDGTTVVLEADVDFIQDPEGAA